LPLEGKIEEKEEIPVIIPFCGMNKSDVDPLINTTKETKDT
jgi:hypothetical protein